MVDYFSIITIAWTSENLASINSDVLAALIILDWSVSYPGKDSQVSVLFEFHSFSHTIYIKNNPTFFNFIELDKKKELLLLILNILS